LLFSREPSGDPVPDEVVTDLLRKAPFSFIMTDIPIDERTAIARVEQVLHGPEMFTHMEGHQITLQLAADVEPLEVGDTAAFFVEGLAFGETVAVREIGRISLENLEPGLTAAGERGGRGAFESELRQLDAERLGEHARGSDAIVLGRVVKLENIPGSPTSEHDPDWWTATLQVDHVESGHVELGELGVLYANSPDVRWHEAPKPKPSQVGMWILHATEGKLAEIASFQILHPEDYQPVHQLDVVRSTGEVGL
jgi:hypothetical protein